MTQSLFVSSGYRAMLRKLSAGFLMLSLNLTGGLGAFFLSTEVTYALAPAPSSIFSDGLESTTFGNWTSSTGRWHEDATDDNTLVAGGTKSARVTDDTGTINDYLTKVIPTSGYTNIQIEYYTKVSTAIEAGDFVRVEWRSTSSGVWEPLASSTALIGPMSTTTWLKVVGTFPSTADNKASFEFRFSAHLQDVGRDADNIKIDDVSLMGTQIMHTLTVASAGTGSGAVSSATQSYSQGTPVTLTAEASPSSTFTGWSGDCSGMTCSVTMSAAKSVTATFTLNTFALALAKAGNGAGSVSSSPSGITCDNSCPSTSATFNYNQVVVLTATPAPGSTFAGWSGGGCSGTSSCVSTITTASTITATFTVNSHIVAVTKAGNGYGTMTSSPEGIICGVDCDGAFTYGTFITLSASPMTGSTFTGWTGDCSGGTCTITVDAAKTAVGTFTLNTHTLTVSTTGAGTGSVGSTPLGISCGMGGGTCSNSFNFGEVVTLTASADITSIFTGWSGDCAGTGACVVTMSTARNVTANFATQTCPQGQTGTPPNCVTPPQSCEANTSTMTRVSNTTDVKVGTPTGPPAVAVGFIHSAWTSIPGATWIWSESPIANPANNPIDSFFDVFTVVGTPTSGSITISGDNSFEVYMNGTLIGQDLSGTTYASPMTISTGATIVTGQNTLEIRVKNLGVGSTEGNPAGVLYKLTINKNACVADVCPNIPEAQPTLPSGYEMVGEQCVLIPICEPRVNLVANGGFENPVLASSWDIIPFTNIALKWLGEFVTPGGAGRLGLELQTSSAVPFASLPYAGTQLAELDGDHPTRIYQDVVTIPGHDYSLKYFFSSRPNTVASENILEVALGGGVIDTHTGAGGPVTNWTSYTKTFLATTTVTRVAFADIGNDDAGSEGGVGSYLDDVSFSCVAPHVEKALLVIKKNTVGGDGTFNFTLNGNEFSTTSTITTVGGVGASSAITLTPDASYTVNEPTVPEGWEFTGLRCEYEGKSAGITGNTPTSHVVSVEAGDTVTCTYTNTKINSTPKLTVIKHVINDNGGTKTASDFTLHVNQPLVDMCSNTDGFQEVTPLGMYREDGMCFPYNDNAFNSVLDFFSPKTAYAAVLQLFSPSTFPGNESGTVVTISNETDYVVTEDADAGYTTTMSADCIGHIALGEHKTCTVTNDDIAQNNGGGGSSSFTYWGCTNPSASNYNPLANKDDGSCTTGGGNGGSGTTTGDIGGEVLGASTTPEELPLPIGCKEYLHDYLKMGKKNNGDEVKLLQTFLNEEMGATLPVSGFFGNMTKNWVKKFQKKYKVEILQPWVDAGYKGKMNDGSGYVYKTTKRHINMMKCAELNIPMPDLSGEVVN